MKRKRIQERNNKTGKSTTKKKKQETFKTEEELEELIKNKRDLSDIKKKKNNQKKVTEKDEKSKNIQETDSEKESEVESDFDLNYDDINSNLEDSEDEKNFEDKKIKSDKSSGMTNTIARLLNKDIGLDSKRPILSKLKQIEKKINNEKLEEKAKKLLKSENKILIDKEREINPGKGDPTSVEFEKKLRKISTKGVVKLFNAIRHSQKAIDDVTSVGIQKNSSEVPVVSKSSFLNMIKSQTPNPVGGESIKKNEVDANEENTVSWARDDFLIEKKINNKKNEKKPVSWDNEDSD